MTLPDERYAAVLRTRSFLLNLLNREHTPRVPKIIRDEAKHCLRHFPDKRDMDHAAITSPNLFQEQMEPLYRMVKQYEQDKKDEN